MEMLVIMMKENRGMLKILFIADEINKFVI